MYCRRYGLRHAMLVIVLFTGEGFARKSLDHFLCSYR
jgi:hypothetical protein